jgi:hypothetical protein
MKVYHILKKDRGHEHFGDVKERSKETNQHFLPQSNLAMSTPSQA